MSKMKPKKNKKRVLLLFFFLCILFLIYLCFNRKNYQVDYTIDSVKITESYDKKQNLYKFIFQTNNKNFVYQIKHKYIHKKKLITKVEIKEKDDTICIIPTSKKIETYPLCNQNNELISYQQVDNLELINKKNIDNNKTDEYNNIKIYNLNNKKYFIWNYKGFDIIDKNQKESIQIMEEDTYNIPLIMKTKNNLLLADYKSKYKFNKFYKINTQNNKVKEITSNEEFSFESYMMGSYKNKVYFMDKKNKKEYEIQLNKSSIRKISSKNKGKVLKNNEWEEISLNKLSSEEIHFTSNQLFNYKIIDNKLYLLIDDYKIKVSNYEIKDIVEIENDTVYYLVNDQLYAFQPQEGETLILSNFEWNFNYKNMIFIF